ncbi:hypothetical protein [Novipirellula aureliae]|nr:hypothetical protein [Novipirellula aureliae]
MPRYSIEKLSRENRTKWINHCPAYNPYTMVERRVEGVLGTLMEESK